MTAEFSQVSILPNAADTSPPFLHTFASHWARIDVQSVSAAPLAAQIITGIAGNTYLRKESRWKATVGGAQLMALDVMEETQTGPGEASWDLGGFDPQ